MKIALASFQKNHSRHLLEWFAWYRIMGVDKFYIYDHGSTDETGEMWLRLADHYDIKFHELLGNDAGPKFVQHYLSTYNSPNLQDWIIQADADEFYYPVEDESIHAVLEKMMTRQIGCLGVYWTMFGSNGQVEWEKGLVTQTYTRRGYLNHKLNHHIKSIVRCNDGTVIPSGNHHIHNASYGTFDVEGRPIHQPLNYPGQNTHNILRINHYYNKSFEYFRTVKQVVGQKADRADNAPGAEITEEFWRSQDLNDVKDDSIWLRFGDKLKTEYENLRNLIA